jgi:hypothetical protein
MRFRERIQRFTDTKLGLAGEWTVTALILVFGSALVAQPYVIPAPHGRLSSRLLPYQELRRGEVIVFRSPDNWDNSHDSRYFGFVPRENFHGKPGLIIWSYAATTRKLSGSPLDPGHLQDFALNFFSKTRGSRTFQLVRGYPLQ